MGTVEIQADSAIDFNKGINMDNQPAVSAARDTNLPALANALELGGRVIERLNTEMVATTLQGREITQSFTHETIAARLQAEWAAYLGEPAC